MILHWLARVTAVLIFAMFAAYFTGNTFDYYGLNRTQKVLLIPACVAVAALPLGWLSEVLGGALNIAGVLAFYTVHFVIRGAWPPGSYPLLAVPGILFLISWWRATAARR